MNTNRHWLGGLIGGLIGGVILAIILTAVGTITMEAAIFGSDSVAVGWIVTLVLMAIFGLTYSWWFGNLTDNYASATGYGVLHGLIWWVLWGLVILPLLVGAQVFGDIFSGVGFMTLIAYMLFGVINGLIFVAIDKPHLSFHQQARMGHT